MFKLLLGDPNARKLKRFQPIVSDINLLEEEIAPLSDDQLRQDGSFQNRLDIAGSLQAHRPILDEILPEAFAVVREAGKRVLGMRHFDVQLIGGMVLHEGQIAEMKTGEGKTLVATLPSYLNALTGRGVHVVTVNDYLARRDAEWMGQVHRFLGLSVGLIQQDMRPEERRRNYNCDITYATNSELGFDYLRDNMAADISEVVQREFQYCVIDEVDSILIDEARTPLIISGQVERPQEKYQRATQVVEALERSAELGKDGIDPDGDYEVDEKQRSCTLTDEGFAKCEQMLEVQDLFDPQDPWAHFITNALKAKELFVKDVNYIVRDGEAVIVDEFTGRVMPGRRWSDGQHQAIEAKESLQIQAETQTLASITYQNFFLLYPRLAGMTGTAKTEEVEFEKTYKLETTIVPTNRCGRVRTGPTRCTKLRLPNGGPWPTKPPRSTSKAGPYWLARHPLRRANCSAPFWLSRTFPITCSTPSQKTSSVSRKLWRRPAVLVPSRLPRIWPAVALTSFSAAIATTWHASSCAKRCSLDW